MTVLLDPLALEWENLALRWTVLLFSVQIICQVLFSLGGPFKSRPAFVAHQVCSLFGVLGSGYYGYHYWTTEANTVHTMQDRLFKPLEGGPVVTRINLAFQIYDLVTTILIPEIRKPEMLGHHTLAIILAYYVIRYQYAHYYAIFFLGMTEISSIPLTFMDVFKHIKSLQKPFEGFNNLCSYAFAALFISIRGIYWPITSYFFFVDVAAAFKQDIMPNKFLAYFFVISNAVLTLLQWYWLTLIFNRLIKMVRKAGGKPVPKKQPPKKQA